jgi:hypothetical protein
MGWHRDLLKRDLKLLKSFLKFCQDHRSIDNVMKMLISKHPFHDVVLVLYLFVALGL